MAERAETANVQLKFRVKERLRAALEEAAQARGVPLNAEIVQRLEASFQIDPDVLREDIVSAAIRVMELVRDSRDKDSPEMKELSFALVGVFVELVAISGSFSLSDHQRQLLQQARRYGKFPVGTTEAPEELAERSSERTK